MFDEELIKTVRELRPIDDIMFRQLAGHKEFIEELLQVLKEDEGLRVIEVHPQETIKGFQGKGVILDVLVRDSKGRYINIEVQKTDSVDHIRRCIYNMALVMAARSTTGDNRYLHIPEVECIYISNFDILDKKGFLCHLEGMFTDGDICIKSKQNMTFVNCARADDKTRTGRYFKQFLKRRIETDEFPEMYKHVKECRERGEAGMCQLVDDYADNRVKKEKIRNVLRMKGKLQIDDISEYLALSKDIVNNILDFNSDDTIYIYEQMKDVDFKLA